MIRVALRQFRMQATVAVGAIAALAVVVLVTRPHLMDVYRTTIANCADRGCDDALNRFRRENETLQFWLGLVVASVPGLIGIFWGAPMVARELESGTFRLAWTQSVTRARWLVTKVAVGGLASAFVAGLASWAVTWWAVPLDRAAEQAFSTFDLRDVVPIGHAVFAFSLGLLIGLVVKRVLPALATTFVAFLVVRLSFTTWVRPELLASKRLSRTPRADAMGFGSADGGPMTLQPGGPRLPDAWVHSVRLVDASGHAITPSQVASACPQLSDIGPPPGVRGDGVVTRAPEGVHDALSTCVAKIAKTYNEVVEYHAANRYWPLQWLETGIYVAAAVALVAVCVWWIGRRAV